MRKGGGGRRGSGGFEPASPRRRATRVDGAAARGAVRAAVGSLGVCDFASLRSTMPAGGRRSEPPHPEGSELHAARYASGHPTSSVFANRKPKTAIRTVTSRSRPASRSRIWAAASGTPAAVSGSAGDRVWRKPGSVPRPSGPAPPTSG